MYVECYKNGDKLGRVRPVFSSFPDGQPHVKLEAPPFDRAEIHCSINTSLDLLHVLLIENILYRTARSEADKIILYVYWLMGARMDRAIDKIQPETFQVIWSILLLIFGVKNIHLLDIHNPTVVEGAQAIDIKPYIQQAYSDFNKDRMTELPWADVIFPDKGAMSRYNNIFPGDNIIVLGKTRDSQTGKLSGFHQESGERKSSKAFICDDIIDAGGTFIGQAKVLREMGYTELGLYTTHGLYTKGFAGFLDFSKIYSTNSYTFNQDGNLFLRVFNRDWVSSKL